MPRRAESRVVRRIVVAFALVTGSLSLSAPSAEAAFVQRVDVGANSPYTDVAGNEWAADPRYEPGGFGYVGGSNTTIDAEIANTSDPTLYTTFRRGPSFEYRFDVPNGTFTVQLLRRHGRGNTGGDGV